MLLVSTLTSVLSLSPAPAESDASAAAPPARSSRSRGDVRWIERWAPEKHLVELGLFGGLMFPHPRLELFEARPALPEQGFEPLTGLAPEVGARLGYYPLRQLGLEAEGAWLPSETSTGSGVNLWAVRGHIIAQIPRWSITPFVLAGPSGLAVASGSDALGNDIDLGFHFGGGVKVFVSRRFMVRLDVRDTLTARRGLDAGVVHSPEVLLGLGLALNRAEPEPAVNPDRDGDGILDVDDRCIETPGVREFEGCPVPDSDGDGILDPDDRCVDEPGVPEFEGCPVPDSDGDGVLDPNDKCVDEPGVPEFEGCPIPDSDRDGILDPDDRCVDEPEVVNSFEDDDGCPDVLPDEVKKFTGVIEGIYFDTAKATIKKKSNRKLDDAVEVLKKFPALRIEVSGHTDDRGNDAYNQALSERRADAVKAYMVDRGVDAGRITTRGAGESQPRESNATKAGRGKNRRIEFKLLQP